MRITPDTVRPPTVLTALRPTSRKESTSNGISKRRGMARDGSWDMQRRKNGRKRGGA